MLGFHEEVPTPDNAFNKGMSQEPPLPDTTTKVIPKVFTPDIETRNSKSTTNKKAR